MHPTRDRTTAWGLAGTATILVAMAVFVYGEVTTTRTLLPAVVAIPVLVLLASPVLVRARALEPDFDLAGIMLLSLGLKFIGAYFRIAGAVDALEYNREGARLATSFRQLDFFVDTGREVPGTGTVRYVTGLVHVATGSTFVATFLVFTFLSWLGLSLFWRAFRAGVPQGDRRRYALLVFLWPSLLFWPSSLGKEALLVTTVGLLSWGAARLLTHERGGLVMLGLGLAGTAMIRPHVALIALVAVVAATLLRRSEGDPVARLAAKVAAVLVLLVGGAVLATATAEFLDLESLGTTEISGALGSTEAMTSQGGSAFAPARVDNPLEYPWAVVTVLFRPFPSEAGSREGLLSSLEGMLLMALFLLGARRLAQLPSQAVRHPYLIYAVAFVAVFAFAFAVIGNFGILVRQRTVATALVMVPLAVRAPAPRTRRAPDWGAPDPAPATGAGPVRGVRGSTPERSGGGDGGPHRGAEAR